MQKKHLSTRVWLCGAGVLLATQVAALPSLNAGGGIQAGLWEAKVTQQVVNGQDVLAITQKALQPVAQMLKDMPPAQRQQMEKTITERFGEGAGGTAMQICISPAMAVMDKPLPTKGMQCDSLKTQRTGNSLDYEMSCKTATHGVKGKGKNSFTAASMKTQIDMEIQDNKTGFQQRIQSASEMRFISKDCGAVKPLDAQVKELEVAGKAQPKR